MKGLILNDFYAMRKLLKSILFVFVIFGVIWGIGKQPTTGALVISVMGISYLFNLFSYDEYYHWDQYAAILPVTRKQIVLARYATFGITALLTLAISLVYVIALGEIADCAMVLVTILCMQGYTAAVIIPVAYKFGIQRGRILYVLLMFVPFGVLLGLMTALQLDGGFSPDGSMLAGILVGVVAVVALMVAISIKISIGIVSKKTF